VVGLTNTKLAIAGGGGGAYRNGGGGLTGPAGGAGAGGGAGTGGTAGGGGGGYSSGGAYLGGGDGGGSFDAGINQILIANFHTGNGEVVITELAAVPASEFSSPAAFAGLLAGFAALRRRRSKT
jgi:uncharacterized protein (TIGR03382 family)